MSRLKFRVVIDNDDHEHGRMWLPYISPHRGLRRVLVIWGWLYAEIKLVRR